MWRPNILRRWRRHMITLKTMRLHVIDGDIITGFFLFKLLKEVLFKTLQHNSHDDVNLICHGLQNLVVAYTLQEPLQRKSIYQNVGISLD